jgi:hypothetical protein
VEDFQSAREHCVQESAVDRSSQRLLVLEPQHRRQESTPSLFSFALQLEAAIRELFSRLLAGLVGLKIYFYNGRHVLLSKINKFIYKFHFHHQISRISQLGHFLSQMLLRNREQCRFCEA